MKVINAPIAPSEGVGVIYHVTLASGMILTNPIDFGCVESESIPEETIVAEDGRILALCQKDRESREMQAK